MKKILGTMTCLILIISTNAIGFTKEDEGWIKKFGGESLEYGYSCQQTYDGGYIVTGATFLHDAEGSRSYIWLIKVNSFGDKIWDRTYGEGGSFGYSVEQTNDGGYIIVGYGSFDNGYGLRDICLIKTDSSGYLEWVKTFGGEDIDVGCSVKQTYDGGYIIVGETKSYGAGHSDVWLIKTDEYGDMIWDQTYGGSEYDIGDSVLQINDGGYVIVGETCSYGAGRGDVWLIKTDEYGNIIWDQTYGGYGGDRGHDVKQTLDGGYIIIGETHSFGYGGYDAWLIKTDEMGYIMWSTFFGTDGDDEGNSVDVTSDGGYIIAGGTWPYNVRFNSWLIKTDEDGMELWEHNYEQEHDNSLLCVQQTYDGGYIATGSLRYNYDKGNYDLLLIKTDSQGEIEDKSRTPDAPLLSKILEFFSNRFPTFYKSIKLFANLLV